MLEHMKKSDMTDTVSLTFTGPVINKDRAVKMLEDLGFTDTSGSVDWRDAFPEYDDKDIPGVCLSAARDREGLTQKTLSKKTGIPQRHISEMENGKRAIGKKTAKKLAEALNTGYRVFL